MKKKFLLAFSALVLTVTLSGLGTASANLDIGPCKPGEKYCPIKP